MKTIILTLIAAALVAMIAVSVKNNSDNAKRPSSSKEIIKKIIVCIKA